VTSVGLELLRPENLVLANPNYNDATGAVHELRSLIPELKWCKDPPEIPKVATVKLMNRWIIERLKTNKGFVSVDLQVYMDTKKKCYCSDGSLGGRWYDFEQKSELIEFPNKANDLYFSRVGCCSKITILNQRSQKTDTFYVLGHDSCRKIEEKFRELVKLAKDGSCIDFHNYTKRIWTIKDWTFWYQGAPVEREFYDKLNETITLIVERIQPKIGVLEICGGNGSLAKKILEKHPRLPYYCLIDSNEEAIMQAKENLKEFSQADIRGDSIDPVKPEIILDHKVDLIIGSGALTFNVMSSRKHSIRVLDELVPKLTLGGYLILSGFSPSYIKAKDLKERGFEVKNKFDCELEISLYIARKVSDCFCTHVSVGDSSVSEEGSANNTIKVKRKISICDKAALTGLSLIAGTCLALFFVSIF